MSFGGAIVAGVVSSAGAHYLGGWVAELLRLHLLG